MDDLQKRLDDTVSWLREAYAGIRTGQAAPALLDGIKVESYGAMMPINQVGTVGVEDARTLRVSTWDAGTIPAIERAITTADLGVSVATDSSGLRVVFPELTSERRTQLLKLAKQKLEDARVRVKGVRDDEMKAIEKGEEMSDDEKFTKKNTVQGAIEKANKALEELYTQKETEISK